MLVKRKLGMTVASVLLGVGLIGAAPLAANASVDGSATPSASTSSWEPSPSAAPAPAGLPTPSEAPTLTPSAAPSPSEGSAPDPSATPSPSESPSADPSASPDPSVSPSDDPSVSPEPSLEPRATPSASVEPSEEPSATPEPTLELGAASVAQGDTVPVTGTGFEPGETVRVELHSTPIVLATVVSTSEGNISLNVAIPLDITPEEHTIVLVGETSGRSVSLPLVVEPIEAVVVSSPDAVEPEASPSAVAVAAGSESVPTPTPTPAEEPGGALSLTGSDAPIVGMALGAGALMLIGVALTGVARRESV